MFNKPYWLRADVCADSLLNVACFDPVSAAVIGLGAVGGIMSADAQRDALRANERIAAQNAELARKQAEFEERRTRQETDRVLSAQRAAAGASGSALDGSALAIMLETAYEGELDAQFIKETGLINATRYSLEADAFGAQANAAWVGGLLGVASGVATGLGRAGNLATPTP